MPDPKKKVGGTNTTEEYEDLVDLVCHRTDPGSVDEESDEEEEDE